MRIKYHIYDPAGNITVFAEGGDFPEIVQSTDGGDSTTEPSTAAPDGKLLTEIAEKLMREVPDAEQVGFIFPAQNGGDTGENHDVQVEATGKPCNGFYGKISARLIMAGGEFCGNASVSLGAHLAREQGYGSSKPCCGKDPEIGSKLSKQKRDKELPHVAEYLFIVSGAESPVSVSVTNDGEGGISGTVEMPVPTQISKMNFYLNRIPQGAALCGVEKSEFDLELLEQKRNSEPSTAVISPKTVQLPVVSLPGIDHIIVSHAQEVFDGLTDSDIEKLFVNWTKELDSQAFGLMLLDDDYSENDVAEPADCIPGRVRDGESLNMRPLLYVPGAGTLVWENACGSGSAAVAAWKAISLHEPVEMDIAQPGGTIRACAGAFAPARTTRLFTEDDETIIPPSDSSDYAILLTRNPATRPSDSVAVAITKLSIRVPVKYIRSGQIDCP